MITKNHYDLIFLDHMMPDLDGVETIKKMQVLDNNLCAVSDIPVAITSALCSTID